jgi:uncharacterized protein (DUF427 family)
MSADSGDVRVEESEKRVRALFAGTVIADTYSPRLVWENPFYPTYYLSEEDVRGDLLYPTGDTHTSVSRGEAEVLTVKVGDREAVGAALRYRDSPVDRLRGTIRLEWDAMDAWFEEDDEVFAHARNPYTRIDVLQSSRHVRVDVDGTTVADSRRPLLLFETGMPVRTYLPKLDVRLDLLEPSQTTWHCPYKGLASYYHVVIDGRRYEDLVWAYPYPALESAAIAGHVCFYDEKVDVYIDGVLRDLPSSGSH